MIRNDTEVGGFEKLHFYVMKEVGVCGSMILYSLSSCSLVNGNTFEEDYCARSKVVWSAQVDKLKIVLPIITLCHASSLMSLDLFIPFIF